MDNNELERLKALVDQLSRRLEPLQQKAFSYRETGLQLGCSAKQVSRLVAEGKLRALRNLGTRPKISAEEIARVLSPPVIPARPKVERGRERTGRAAADEVRAALRSKARRQS